MPEPEFGLTATERGAGMTCPWHDCGGKFIVNLSQLTKPSGRRTDPRTLLCPYCERVSLMPGETS
jgi:hypothetical protein